MCVSPSTLEENGLFSFFTLPALEDAFVFSYMVVFPLLLMVYVFSYMLASSSRPRHPSMSSTSSRVTCVTWDGKGPRAVGSNNNKKKSRGKKKANKRVRGTQKQTYSKPRHEV